MYVAKVPVKATVVVAMGLIMTLGVSLVTLVAVYEARRVFKVDSRVPN
jgi:hypothetical protein